MDVFGDGSVEIISTPGHTPGHESLLVRLPKMGFCFGLNCVSRNLFRRHTGTIGQKYELARNSWRLTQSSERKIER